MATRLIGTDSADPKLPDVVIAASIGTTAGTLASGDSIAIVYAAEHGAIGDGTNEAAKLQAAVDAAEALVGASSLDIRVCVELGLGKHYRVNGGSVVLPKGVYIHMNGSKIQALTAGTVIKLEGYESGVECGTVWGVSGATAGDGIHMSSDGTGGRQIVKDVTFDALGGRAILCEAIASRISGCTAQGCLGLANSLAVPTGVLEINTTDVWVGGQSEFTASRTALSTGGFANAVVIKGGTHTLEGVIAEISDHGFYITGSETRLIGCRADLNYGHGFRLISPSTGSLSACLSLRNGRETTNTYDGFNFADATNWLVDDCRASSLSADAWKHRYGFYDATNGYGNYNQFNSTNRSTLATTAPIFVEPFAGSKVDPVQGPFLAAAAAATTIDLQQYGWPASHWTLSSVSAVNFTDFLLPVAGMHITVFGDGFTTFVHNASVLRMNSGVSTLAVVNVAYEFVDRNGIWYQVDPAIPFETRWIGAESFTAGGGTPVLYAFGGGTSFFSVQLMDAAADESINSTMFVPNEWNTYAIDLWWTNQAGGAGDIRVQGTGYQVVDAGVMTTADVTMTAQVVTAPVAATIKVTNLATAVTNLGGLLALIVTRVGTHASDTLANDAAFVGINLRRLT